MKRVLKPILLFLLLGAAVNALVAWMLAILIDIQSAAPRSAEQFSGNGLWTVTRWDRPGATRIISTRNRGLNWSPEQALGPPDTPNPGDQVTAWASATADGGMEWLDLTFAKEVIPREVQVHENCAPGALIKVCIFDPDGREIEAWSGIDPTPQTAPMGISRIPIELSTPTRRVKIFLASDKVPGWNEIDAVALVSNRGVVQWAQEITASSTYASSRTGAATGGVALLVPAWCRLDPSRQWSSGAIRREDQVIEARGWPMLALASYKELAEISHSGTGKEMSTLIDLTSFIPAGASPPPQPSSPGLQKQPLVIPVWPIWIGFASNTLFYGALLGVLWAALVIPRRFVRQVARLRHGRCIHCGYDLGYDFVKGCPECGWRRT